MLGGYDRAQYASERLWASARDGVRVPISIVYRKDRAREGRGPLLLYGYGAYGYGLQASFSSSRLSLLIAAWRMPSRTYAAAMRWASSGDSTACS